MAIRDVLVLNTTASRAETQQGSDTVAIRGNSGEALSVENSSGTSILSVNTVSSSVDVAGKITATTNVSSSLSSTGSFGRLEATTLVGDAFNLTGTAIDGTISSSGQIANQISGSFRRGFEFTGTIGDTIPDQENRITASFGRIVATSLSGSAANLTNTDLDNTISGSAQIASQISGAFDSGFEFTGTISGSATSTGSFGRVVATTITGDVRNMTNIVKAGLISGSGQIASRISGSFNRGFEFSGEISGSATSTGSLGKFVANKAVGDISGMTNILPTGTVSSSAQLATAISGAFDAGFEFTGTISGSATSTGSFSHLVATTITGDVSGMSNLTKTGFLSSSAQLATSISGSFNKGFEFSGEISGKLKTWAFGTNMGQGHMEHGAVGNKASALVFGGFITAGIVTPNSTEEWNGSNWSYGGDMITARTCMAAFGISTEAAISAGGTNSDSEEYNGSAWSETNEPIVNTRGGGGTGTTEAGIVAGRTTSPYQQTETFNGTNWSEVNDLITGNSAGFGRMIGTQNAGYYKHPGAGSNTSLCTQEWNGTNWSEVNDSNTQRTGGGGFAGSVNDAWLAGGHPGTPATTEEWDGTAWSNLPASSNLNCIRRYSFGIGLPSAGMQTGGQKNPNTHPYTDNTIEEFTHAIGTGSFGRVEATSISGDISNLTNTTIAGTISSSGQIASYISGSFNKGFEFTGNITSKAVVFSSGGDLNCAPGAAESGNVVGSTYRGAAGNKNAGLVFGGFRYSGYKYIGNTEEYNGTSWSEVNDMIDAGSAAGGGTSEAAIATGGSYRNCDTEEWNGTNWSEVNHQISDKTCTYKPLSIGNSSEALITAGGNNTAPYGQTESWNGTNWSATTAMIHDPRGWHGGAGTQNAGLTAGGPHGSNTVSCTETWNGLSWTEGASALISNMKIVSMAGSQNDTLLAGHAQGSSFNGNIFSNPANFSECSICWDGIVWSTSTDLGSRRLGMSAAGSNSDVGFFAGGIDISSPHSFACTIVSETFVASASFSHIEATKITASVDGMTNIDPPTDAISGSAQIASNISGSFNKGFEFDGELRSLGVWTSGADFTGCFQSTYSKLGYSAIGTRDAAIVAGASGVYQVWVSETYAYNGVAWSDTGHHMIQGGSHSAHGTANAGLAIGRHSRAPGTGYFYTCTEEYNGSAWSETTDLPYTLKNLNNQSAGTQNAALTAGGNCDTGNDLDAIKRHALAWDGLSYSHVGTLAEARDSAALTGTVNAALAQGGGSDSSTNDLASDSTCTEEWNGSAWSTAAASNFPTGCGVMASGKSSNDSMHVYDASNASLKSDVYNGMTWNLGPNMNGTGRIQDYGAAGTTGRSFFMARVSSAVEHFDENHVTSSIGRVDANELSLESDTDLTVNESLQIPQYATNPPVTGSAGEVWYNTAEEKLYFTYDVNSWTEMADTNTTRTQLGGLFGTTAAAIHYGGLTGPAGTDTTADTEQWNGISWTEVNNLIQDRQQASGVGLVNAGLAAGGASGNATTEHAETEEWNGTNWTEVADLIAARAGGGHAGTVNASIYYGGRSPNVSDSEEWNGTVWTEGNNLIQARKHGGFNGTQNTAWIAGGAAPSALDSVEHYNGTSWSTQTALPGACNGLSGAGSQTAGMVFGGESPFTTALEWNGQSWTAVDSLNSNHFRFNGDGTQANALAVGTNGVTETYTTTGIGCHCIGGV